MAKTLFADGKTGVVCIYTGSNDVVTTPSIDYNRVFFHSNLPYLHAAVISNTNINFSSFGSGGLNETRSYTVDLFSGDWITDYIPLLYMNQTIPLIGGKYYTYYHSGSQWRRVSINMDTTRVFLDVEESTMQFASESWGVGIVPAQTVSFRMIAVGIIP